MMRWDTMAIHKGDIRHGISSDNSEQAQYQLIIPKSNNRN